MDETKEGRVGAMFFVFLRNDGLIDAIAADNRRIADAQLAPSRGMSFDILLETDDWTEASAYIEAAREG